MAKKTKKMLKKSGGGMSDDVSLKHSRRYGFLLNDGENIIEILDDKDGNVKYTIIGDETAKYAKSKDVAEMINRYIIIKENIYHHKNKKLIVKKGEKLLGFGKKLDNRSILAKRVIINPNIDINMTYFEIPEPKYDYELESIYDIVKKRLQNRNIFKRNFKYINSKHNFIEEEDYGKCIFSKNPREDICFPNTKENLKNFIKDTFNKSKSGRTVTLGKQNNSEGVDSSNTESTRSYISTNVSKSNTNSVYGFPENTNNAPTSVNNLPPPLQEFISSPNENNNNNNNNNSPTSVNNLPPPPPGFSNNTKTSKVQPQQLPSNKSKLKSPNSSSTNPTSLQQELIKQLNERRKRINPNNFNSNNNTNSTNSNNFNNNNNNNPISSKVGGARKRKRTMKKGGRPKRKQSKTRKARK